MRRAASALASASAKAAGLLAATSRRRISAHPHHHHCGGEDRPPRPCRRARPEIRVAVRRWERYTNGSAVLDGTGQTFEDVEAERTAANDSAVAGKEVA
jgi:hypothetical protein